MGPGLYLTLLPSFRTLSSYWVVWSTVNMRGFAFSYCLLFVLLRDLLFSEEEPVGGGMGFGGEGRYGVAGRSGGKGNCGQDVSYERII